MLLLKDTLNTVFQEIIQDEKIMTLMNLPTVYKDDSEKVKTAKINKIIKQAITLSSQNPKALGEQFPKVKIGDKIFEKYGRVRMTIYNVLGDNLGSDVFGRPKLEIDVYHLNEDVDIALEIIDRLTTKFSRRKIDIEWTDDDGNKHISPRELTYIGATTQIANINNYEQSGVRFYYYASHYSSY